MKHKLGMTLIEVTILLLAVLIITAIIFPVFNTPKHEKSRRVSCMSNMKQIGLAMLQYAQDNDINLPPRQAVSNQSGRLVSWRSLIYPYTKNKNVFRCPSNPANDTPDLENDGMMRSYAANTTTVARRGASGPFSNSYASKLNLASIKQPASVIAVTETTAAYNDLNITLPAAFTASFGAHHDQGSHFCGHDGYANYLFTDGHVKTWRPLQTLNMDGQNLWTRDNSAFSPADQLSAMQTLQYAQRHFPAKHG